MDSVNLYNDIKKYIKERSKRKEIQIYVYFFSFRRPIVGTVVLNSATCKAKSAEKKNIAAYFFVLLFFKAHILS